MDNIFESIDRKNDQCEENVADREVRAFVSDQLRKGTLKATKVDHKWI